MVKIISIDGVPLMPTKRFGKVRRLLKDKKAEIVCKNPFTIKLLYKTETENISNINIGIDLGYKFIGFAFVGDNGIVIEKGTIELRQDVKNLLTLKRTLRRGRRNRNTRYRKPRFLNRTRPSGWLPPSTQSKYNHTLNWIEKLVQNLPSCSLKVEIANFDIAKIDNPNIDGEEYQQGSMYQFGNAKQYLLARENGKCQLCKKPYKEGEKWHLHHIISRSNGGSDRVSNLALLHESCHSKVHRENKFDKIKKPKQYKDATFMNVIKHKIVKDLLAKYSNVSFTFGYITSIKREELELSKAHYNDAIAIAETPISANNINPIYIKQVRKKKRSLHEATARRGRKTTNIEAKRNSKNTKEVFVNNVKFALYDKVKVGKKIGFITGFSGKMVYVQNISGEYLKMDGKSYKQIPTKNIKHIKRNNNWVTQYVS